MTDRREDIRARVMACVEIVDAGHGSPCWLWTGPHSGNGRGGDYPRMKLSGQTVAVHRVTFTNEHGYIPGKKHLDHLCRNRRCVNPDHLDMVTAKRNAIRREEANGRRRKGGGRHDRASDRRRGGGMGGRQRRRDRIGQPRVAARQIAAYRLWMETDMTAAEVARRIGRRDHAAAIAAILAGARREGVEAATVSELRGREKALDWTKLAFAAAGWRSAQGLTLDQAALGVFPADDGVMLTDDGGQRQ